MLKLVESTFAEQQPAETNPQEFAHHRPARRTSLQNKRSRLEERKEFEFSLNHDYSVIGEEALWRAVITQALMDAGNRSSRREAKVLRTQAIAWFSRRNPDFQLVCALAGMDPEYVFEHAQEAIRKGCKWRKEPNTNQKNKR